MAKVDIYHYSSPTDVTSVTLSNCDSTNTSDYAVTVYNQNSDDSHKSISLIKPHAISGTTMTLQNNGATPKCELIMVTQKG